MVTIRTTPVRHYVEYLANLRPGETAILEFNPDPGAVQVHFHLDRIIGVEEYATRRRAGSAGLASGLTGRRATGLGGASAVYRARLPGRLRTGSIRDLADPGDVFWDPPEQLPTTYPVDVKVGPVGGPYEQKPGPQTTWSLGFNGPAPTPAGGGGDDVDLLDVVDVQSGFGGGPGPARRPPLWEACVTNIDPEKAYQTRVMVVFSVSREVSVSRLPRARLTTVFEGALRWVTPIVRVRHGAVSVGLQPDAQEVLDVAPTPPVATDRAEITDIDFTMEGVNFEVISAGRMLRDAFTDLAAELTGPPFPPPFDNPISVPSDFVDRLVDAALGSADLTELATDLVEFPGKDLFRAGVHDVVSGAFTRLDIPHKIPSWDPIRRDDIALKTTISVTEIRGAFEKSAVGTGEVFVDSVRADFYAVLRANWRHEPHPGVAYAGEYTPTDHVSLLTRFWFRIGDIDVDLHGGSGVLDKLKAEAAELLVNIFDEDIARAVENVVNSSAREFLAQKDVLNPAVETVIRGVANRDHMLHDMRLEPIEVVLETFDPRAGENWDGLRRRRPRRPVGVPIDGQLPADADQRLQAIDHIVVVTMENRSFDNMLGYLSHTDREAQPAGPRPDVDGLTGNERIPLGGGVIGSPITPLPRSPEEFHPDPAHGYDAVQLQLGPTGAMDGFLESQRQRILESTSINQDGPLRDETNIVHFQPASKVPLYDYLASEFCVLNRYFCAFPGGTQPNRVCMLTGATPVLRNSEFTADLGYLDMPTMFDLLNPATTSWRYYEGDIGFLRVFDKYRLDFTHLRPLEEFLDGSGALPNVTFIDPNFKETPSAEPPSDDHAPTPVCRGQFLLAQVMQRLARQARQDQESTLLIITYDEHGGFYDHVAPPGTAAFDLAHPNIDRNLPPVHPQAHTYGVRVPALLASPRIARASVSDNIYDHTAVTRTILQRFAPDRIGYMPERVRRSRHFGELLLTTPRTSIRPAPDAQQAGCRESSLAISTPASAVYYDRITHEPDDERATLQALGTHGLTQ